jgi:integrase
MASFVKTKSGKYKFIVTVNYRQVTKTFDTKAEGYLWEEKIKAGRGVNSISFGQLLEKYRDEITINKKGRRWEEIRINKFLREMDFLNVQTSDLNTSHFSDWRNKRMKEVSNLSVLREIAVLNPILNTAVREWKLLEENPLTNLKKPKKPPARDRLISQDEIDRLCYCLNYSLDAPISLISSRVGACFIFAIETALRSKEVCQLRWVDVMGDYVKVVDSKTPTGIRDVPLTDLAIKIITQCKGIDDNLVFGITDSQRDSIFRKAKSMASVKDLHFHDTRHEAITRLSKKLDVLELARMVGHKNISELMTYYNETASEIGKKLRN